MAHYILYKDFYIFALLSWKMTDENYVWEKKNEEKHEMQKREKVCSK